ncbi:beta strand repeat-containing protein, partial [Flavobacterium flevense]
SDANKPISTATQTVLNLKVDKVSGKGLSTEDYTTTEKTKLAAVTGTNTGDQDISGIAINTTKIGDLASLTTTNTSNIVAAVNEIQATKAPLTSPTFAGTVTASGTLTANAIVKSGGTSAQFLKADGSVDSNVYFIPNTSKIAIGYIAGSGGQGDHSIAIGGNTAQGVQAENAIGIGYAAGQYSQGLNSIAIGAFAGNNTQPANSIVLNATGVPLNGSASGLFVDPIRSASGSSSLFYNTTTKEITYGNSPSVSLISGVTGTLPIANGGTGSSTQNFIDLTTNQTIAGTKTFSSNMNINGVTIGKNGSQSMIIGESTYSGTDGNVTAVGFMSLNGNSGANNTALGSNALRNSGATSYNTAIGLEAGSSVNTGGYNTLLGYSAKTNSATPTITNAVAIGNGATVNASNTIQLGNTSITNVNTSGTLTSGAVTYPKTHGTSGQVLSTTGSGTLSWTTPTGGSGTTNYLPRFTSASAIGDSKISDDGTRISIGNPNGGQGSYSGFNSDNNTRLFVNGGRELESIKMSFPGDPYNNVLSFNWYNTAWKLRTERNSANITDLSFARFDGTSDIEYMKLSQLGNLSVVGTVTANSLVKLGGTSSQYLMADGSVSTGAAAVREVADEFTATAAQTSFTLTQTPSVNSKVKMYVNGIRISNTAYSVSGNTLTYNPANNGAYALSAGDRVQMDYYW